MLEYLFNFMKQNIFLIFIVVLFLGIASVYSKRIKFLFLSILGLAALYFALLCLYRLGIGIETLYECSCRFVILICEHIDCFNILCLNHSLFLSKVLEILIQRSFSSAFLYMIHISLIIALIVLAIEVLLPRLKTIHLRKINFNNTKLNKNSYSSNTINKSQNKYIFYSVLRC